MATGHMANMFAFLHLQLPDLQTFMCSTSSLPKRSHDFSYDSIPNTTGILTITRIFKLIINVFPMPPYQPTLLEPAFEKLH